MAGRTGRRRVNANSPVVDLDVVFADDELVDAIAARPWGVRPSSVLGGADRFRAGYAGGNVLTRDPLTDLFECWRDELSQVPMPEPPLVGRLGVRGEPAIVPARRSSRAALSIAAAIAALLVGTASLGSKDAAQDSALWPITRVLWPDRAESIRSADQVKFELNRARIALEQGRAAEAQEALRLAGVALAAVEEVDGRIDMELAVATLLVAATPRAGNTEEQVVTVGRPAVPGFRVELPTLPVTTAAGSSVGPAAAVSDPALLNAAGPGAAVAAAPNGGPANQGPTGSVGARLIPPDPLLTVDPTPDPTPTTVGVTDTGASSAVPSTDEAPTVEPQPAASEPSALPLPTAPAESAAEPPTSPPAATEQSAPTPSVTFPAADPAQPPDAGPLSQLPDDQTATDNDAGAADSADTAGANAATGSKD